MAEDVLEDEGEQIEEEPESAEERARRDAALARIRKLGDPVLRTRALDVSEFDSRLREEVDWMRGVMDDAMGIKRSAIPYVTFGAGVTGRFLSALRAEAGGAAFARTVTEGFDFTAIFFVLVTALAMTYNNPQEGRRLRALHHFGRFRARREGTYQCDMCSQLSSPRPIRPIQIR